METLAKCKISKELLITASKELEPNFQLSEHTDYLYTLLSLYLSNDIDFEKHCLETKTKKYPFSLKKGLFLISAPGAGKSFIFEEMLSNVLDMNLKPIFNWKLLTVYEIQNLYLLHGANAIKEIAPIFNRQDWYIDDLGREVKFIKFFGNDINFMDMFIDYRYRLFKKGIRTHSSSNLNLRELKEYYSSATFSRMFQLFNFIVLDNKIDYRMI